MMTEVHKSFGSCTSEIGMICLSYEDRGAGRVPKRIYDMDGIRR